MALCATLQTRLSMSRAPGPANGAHGNDASGSGGARSSQAFTAGGACRRLRGFAARRRQSLARPEPWQRRAHGSGWKTEFSWLWRRNAQEEARPRLPRSPGPQGSAREAAGDREAQGGLSLPPPPRSEATCWKDLQWFVAVPTIQRANSLSLSEYLGDTERVWQPPPPVPAVPPRAQGQPGRGGSAG